jgi:hypothetical protein
MLITAALNMIELKELSLRLSTTRTLGAIVLKAQLSITTCLSTAVLASTL